MAVTNWNCRANSEINEGKNGHCNYGGALSYSKYLDFMGGVPHFPQLLALCIQIHGLFPLMSYCLKWSPLVHLLS